MGTHQLILVKSPTLVINNETGPTIFESRTFNEREERGPFSKGLIEPEIVPPEHRDHISKPHMSHFVQDHVRALFASAFGHSATEYQEVFTECHNACIFHRSPVEVDYCNLVILFKGICQSKDLLKVGKALLCQLKYFCGVHIFGERFAAVNAKWYDFLTYIFIMNMGVRTGDHGGDVCRDARCSCELPEFSIAIEPGIFYRVVGYDFPILWSQDR